MEDALRRTVERLEVLSEVSSQLLASDKPQEVVESLCWKILPLVDSQIFFNYLVDPQRQRLRLNASGGISAETAREIEWLEFGEAVCGITAQRGDVVVREDILSRSDPGTDLVRALGVRAYACHPLLNQGQVIGTLGIGSKTKASFSEDDLTLMRAVADHVAIAMQRVRLVELLEQQVAERTAVAERRTAQLRHLTSQLVLAEQHERRRMESILHEDLQQMLVAARMKTAILRRRIDRTDQSALLQQIDDLIDRCIEESRSVAEDLSPPVLYDGGLAAGLAWLARQTEENHGLNVTIQVEPDTEPNDMSTRVLLFQAVRELLTNVVEHAQATQVEIGVRCERDYLWISVADNGIGFDPARAEQQQANLEGFGLFSLRERFEFRGGCIDIASTPGQGSRVELVLPQSA